MVLTKAKLRENLIATLGMHKSDAAKLVEIFFEEIICLLEQGEQIRLSGFGNFKLLDKKERVGRNPKTRETAIISARRVVVFRAKGKLKNRINRAVAL